MTDHDSTWKEALEHYLQPFLALFFPQIYDDIDWTGLDFPREAFEKMQEVSREAWRKEVLGHEELFIDVHDHLPPEMIYQRELLICRL